MTKGRTGGSAQIVNWFLGIDSATNRIAADFESAATTATTGSSARPRWPPGPGTTPPRPTTARPSGSTSTASRRPPSPSPTAPAPAAPIPPRSARRSTRPAPPAGFFNGVLDEVRIWNVARSAAQIFAGARPGAHQRHRPDRALRPERGQRHRGRQLRRRRRQRHRRGRPDVGRRLAVHRCRTHPPSAPTGLVASPGNNSVGLSWAANAEPDVAGYRVYRGTEPARQHGRFAAQRRHTAHVARTTSTPRPSTGRPTTTSSPPSTLGGNVSPPPTSASATPSASAGGALDFDGTNDHVTLGAAVGLNSNTFTIETWFRRDGTGVMAATTSGTGGVSAAPLMAKGLLRRRRSSTGSWASPRDGLLAADFESAATTATTRVIGTTALSQRHLVPRRRDIRRHDLPALPERRPAELCDRRQRPRHGQQPSRRPWPRP